MVAIITGDIIASRKLENQEIWLTPLKKLLSSWGERPQNWEVMRGDLFQLEITKPEDALFKAFQIKALIKKIKPIENRKTISTIDVRMAIGIGEKSFAGKTIQESNGTAFIYSGEKFDNLKKENVTLGIKTPWEDVDEELNLYLKLVGIFMNNWSVSSSELVALILNNPSLTQEEAGMKIGIKQSGVSRRWNRAHIDELLEVEKMFRKKILSKAV